MRSWFNFRRTPPVEPKSLGADLLEIFGGLTSPAGLSISTEAARQNTAAASCIRLISESCASLDLAVKRVEDGVEIDEQAHPVARLLRSGAVNDWTSRVELIADLVGDALISDIGGIAQVGRTGDGRAVEIVRLRRGAVQVARDLITDEPSYTSQGRPLAAGDLIHVRAPLGRAALSLASSAIAVAAAMERHAARLFESGGQPRGVLRFQRGMPEGSLRKSLEGWRAAHEGPDSGGKTAILHDGAEFTPLALTSTDSQFLENRKFQILEICRAFRVPPSMIYDLDRATWSNSEQMGREFLSYTLEPWLLTLEAALHRALFLPDEREHYAIRFDRDDLTRADLNSRAAAISSLIASQTLNPNEARSWLGLGPRDGGDEFLNPNITAAPAAPPEDRQ